MTTHSYGLCSKTHAAAADLQSSVKNAPVIPSFSKEDDLLLHVMSDHRDSLLSMWSASKKVKASSGQATLVAWDSNPFSLSDLMDLEELEIPSSNEPWPSSKKQRQ